jgi:hypothetical protein
MGAGAQWKRARELGEAQGNGDMLASERGILSFANRCSALG